MTIASKAHMQFQLPDPVTWAIDPSSKRTRLSVETGPYCLQADLERVALGKAWKSLGVEGSEGSYPSQKLALECDVHASLGDT